MAPRLLSTARLLARGMRSSIHARSVGAPGMLFDSYGRSLGLRVLARGNPAGLDLLLDPLSSMRYWEFPFILSHLPRPSGMALDVASPRLFSIFVVEKGLVESVRMINPDGRDANLTRDLAATVGLERLVVDEAFAASVGSDGRSYDAIWSISVLEHIADDGDTEAVRALWQALEPDGRLLLTVPVDRRSWDEYRRTDAYGLRSPEADGTYFFQRWYDESAVYRRLVDPLRTTPEVVEFFGESEPGYFASYERAWIAGGREISVDDPRLIADHFESFGSWADMPGQGVAGLVLRKERT